PEVGPHARPTLPMRHAVSDRVLRRVRVPLRAVGPARLDTGERLSAQHVLAMRDRLQMVRIDASRRPAEVIQFLPFGDGSHEARVDVPMSYPPSTVAMQAAIASSAEGASPEPAVADVDGTPDAVIRCQ